MHLFRCGGHAWSLSRSPADERGEVDPDAGVAVEEGPVGPVHVRAEPVLEVRRQEPRVEVQGPAVDVRVVAVLRALREGLAVEHGADGGGGVRVVDHVAVAREVRRALGGAPDAVNHHLRPGAAWKAGGGEQVHTTAADATARPP